MPPVTTAAAEVVALPQRTPPPPRTTALPQSCSDGVHDGLMHAATPSPTPVARRRPAHSRLGTRTALCTLTAGVLVAARRRTLPDKRPAPCWQRGGGRRRHSGVWRRILQVSWIASASRPGLLYVVVGQATPRGRGRHAPCSRKLRWKLGWAAGRGSAGVRIRPTAPGTASCSSLTPWFRASRAIR
jgi:hypothetical protein